MKLTEMKQWIEQQGLKLTKSLGQNFMHDQNQLRRIIDHAQLDSEDKVFEIGPGLGPLTEMILERGREVLAIEVDQRLASLVRERFRDNPRFRLVHADALRFLRDNPQDWSEWKLVSNLPYSVGSTILVELAGMPQCHRLMVVTLQMEVAQRLKAVAGDTDYGLLSLLVQAKYVPQNLFKIPASCFFPKPEVDSACITLIRRDVPIVEPALQKTFVRLVKCGFSQRRKMMLKVLSQNWSKPQLLKAFQTVGISETTRAEEVTLEQFGQLAKAIT